MKCLCCYEPLQKEEQNVLHRECSLRVFGTETTPTISLDKQGTINALTHQLAQGRGLTGVQAKFSAALQRDHKRLTLSSALYGYIVKPQTEQYSHLPEIEALSMQLAEVWNLPVAPSSLLYTEQGELVYVSKRVDRLENMGKVRQEDMGQVLGNITENKYKSSHEKIGKAILANCHNPRLDGLQYFNSVLFAFIIGNNDAHLKNFSLSKFNNQWTLTPLYDQVAVRLAVPETQDNEDLALTMNGRKRKIAWRDFQALARTLQITPQLAEAQLRRAQKLVPKMSNCISNSFLTNTQQVDFLQLIETRLSRLNPKP